MVNPPRILIVDDETSVHQLVRSMLRRGEYEVQSFTDPVEALKTARSYPPELVVSDVLMPRMDGWEALPLIKRVSPATQVVVISALGADSELNDRAVWLGAATYLDKVEIMSMPAIVAAACTHN